MGACWRSPTKLVECENAECCYNASAQAVFEYWKFANSKKWKAMIQAELKKETMKSKVYLGF